MVTWDGRFQRGFYSDRVGGKSEFEMRDGGGRRCSRKQCWAVVVLFGSQGAMISEGRVRWEMEQSHQCERSEYKLLLPCEITYELRIWKSSTSSLVSYLRYLSPINTNVPSPTRSVNATMTRKD